MTLIYLITVHDGFFAIQTIKINKYLFIDTLCNIMNIVDVGHGCLASYETLRFLRGSLLFKSTFAFSGNSELTSRLTN